jgi:hypothetical protein
MKRFLARVMSTSCMVAVSLVLLGGCELIEKARENDRIRAEKERQKEQNRLKEEKEAISLAARIAEQERHMGATAEEAAALVLQDNEDGDNDHPDLQ